MGLWNKGYKRSFSNQPRLEKTCIDQKMVNRIINHLTIFGLLYTEYTGDKRHMGKSCICTCEDRTVNLILWGAEMKFTFTESNRIDIPTFMWKIRNAIIDSTSLLSRNMIFICLIRNIEMNDRKYGAGDWDRDDTFFDINPDIFKRDLY